MTAEELEKIKDRVALREEGGMKSVCGEYECDCHDDVPRLLAHIEDLEEQLRDEIAV